MSCRSNMPSAASRTSATLPRLGSPRKNHPQLRTDQHDASARGPRRMGTLLLTAGAQVSAVDAEGYTPLVRCTSIAAALLLIEAGAQVDATGNDGSTALMHAAHRGVVEHVRLLIEKGADVRMSTDLGRSAIYYAVSGYGRPARITAILEELIGHGADVNEEPRDGETVLMFASSNADPDVVKFLLSKGADANAVTPDGATALHYAFDPRKALDVSRLERVATHLLEHDANPNALRDDGISPLHLAAQGYAPELVRLLIDAGANLGLPDRNGNTPLMLACERGWQKVIESLITAYHGTGGQDISAALLRAVEVANKDPTVFQCVIGADAVPKWRAIEAPNINEDLSIFQCLIGAGADPKWRNPNGESALSLAAMFSKDDPRRLFLEGLACGSRSTV
jgi:ankyrin repeat protein